nr:hypothetical protein REQ54_01768 [Rhizobium sp. Q54]
MSIDTPIYGGALSTLGGIRARVEPLSLRELLALYEAAKLGRDCFLAIVNQPRFETCGERNAAGIEVENLIEAMNDYIQHIVDIARNRTPQTTDDVDNKAEIVLDYDIRCGDALRNIAADAAQYAAQRDSLWQIERGVR